MKLRLLFVSFCLSVMNTLTAQLPDYSGVWILNLEKSRLEDKPDGLTGAVFIIEQKGNKVSLTRYHVFGDHENKIHFKMKADGKTRRVKLLFSGKLEWEGENLTSTLWRRNFLNIVKYSFGMNQNEFIADENYTGTPRNHHNVWVFDRGISR